MPAFQKLKGRKQRPKHGHVACAVATATGPHCVSKTKQTRACRLAKSQLQQLSSDPQPNRLLKFVKDIGNDLQRFFGHWLAKQDIQKHATATATDQTPSLPDEQFAQTLLYDVERPVSSRAAESKYSGLGLCAVQRKTIQGASALISAGGYLWGCSFSQLADMVQKQAVRPIMLIRKRRYDETPTRIQVPAAHSGPSEKNRLAKVLQSEFQLAGLCQDVESSCYFFFKGHAPTWLVAVDSCTADVTKFVQDQLEQNIPELERLSHMFPTNIQMINTDAYAANTKAERAIAMEHPSSHLTHYFCDHHNCCTCLTKGFNLVPDCISGMIAGALAMQGAGETATLRRCLMNVIRDRLQVHIGPAPAGRIAAHRKGIHELFLQIPPDTHRKKD